MLPNSRLFFGRSSPSAHAHVLSQRARASSSEQPGTSSKPSIFFEFASPAAAYGLVAGSFSAVGVLAVEFGRWYSRTLRLASAAVQPTLDRSTATALVVGTAVFGDAKGDVPSGGAGEGLSTLLQYDLVPGTDASYSDSSKGPEVTRLQSDLALLRDEVDRLSAAVTVLAVVALLVKSRS